jgi:hypothetical protein
MSPPKRCSQLRVTDARLSLILNGKQAANFGEIVDRDLSFKTTLTITHRAPS